MMRSDCRPGRWIPAVWFFLHVMAAGTVLASELTLRQAIDTALAHNPEVRAAAHELEAARAQVTQARSGLLPQLSVSESFTRTDSPLWAFGTKLNQGAITADDFDPRELNDPRRIDNFRTALGLSWNLFDGGQTWIGLDQARQNQAVGDLGVTRSRQGVIARTALAYIGGLLAERHLIVIDKSLETARAHAKVAQDRLASGLAVQSDALRAQVRVADLEQQRLQAQSQVLVARAMLHASMGDTARSQEASVLVTPLEQCQALEGELADWIARAQQHRPELKQVALQEEIAQKQIGRARAGRWPTLALQGNYEINSRDFSDAEDNYTLGAVLELPLYSGQRVSGRAAEAKAMAARARALRESLELGVRVEVEKAFHQARSTWASIGVARAAVDQAQEALRITANRYENGLLALVSLLDAQTALQQAQTRHFQALHDYQAARIALALAGGTIDPNIH